MIETRLRLDPTSDTQCGAAAYGAVQIWAHDHTILVILGFSADAICLAYPDEVRYSMDTTDGFHVYRLEARGLRVKVYVDDTLAIDHTLSWPGGGSDILMFGDGNGDGKSRSYWDYFWYDVIPPWSGVGGAVTGIRPRWVVCRNLTTGQEVQFDAAGVTAWDCEAAGLTIRAGDRVAMRVYGPVEASAEALGGSVTSFHPVTAHCTNLTTDQQVDIALEGTTAWDCEAAGLVVHPEDRLQTSVQGHAD
jgi:hypothetical protein